MPTKSIPAAANDNKDAVLPTGGRRRRTGVASATSTSMRSEVRVMICYLAAGTFPVIVSLPGEWLLSTRQPTFRLRLKRPAGTFLPASAFALHPAVRQAIGR